MMAETCQRLGLKRHWPYINVVLSILKMAYQEFAERVGDIKGAASN